MRVVAVGDAVDTAHEDIFLPMRNYINELYARDTSGENPCSLTDENEGRPFYRSLCTLRLPPRPAGARQACAGPSGSSSGASAVCRGGRRRCSVGACGAAECSGRSAALGLSRQCAARRMDGRNGAAYPAKRGVPRHAHSGKNTKTVLQIGKSPSDSTGGAVCRTALPRGTSFRRRFSSRCSSRGRSRRISRSAGFVNVFTGIAFCADCGRAMSTVGTRRKGSRADLACGGYKQHGRRTCTRHGTNYEALEAAVLDVLHRHLALTEGEKAELRERLMHSLCSPEGEDAHGLRRSLSRTEDTIAALYLDRATGRLAEDSFLCRAASSGGTGGCAAPASGYGRNGAARCSASGERDR